MQEGITPGPSKAIGGVPTVGQAISPIMRAAQSQDGAALINRVAQMPLPQATRLAAHALRGIAPQQIGTPEPTPGPPRRPVEAPPPSVGLSGAGGGLTPEVQRFSGTRADRNFNPGNIAFGDWARAHGATGSAGRDTGHGVAVFASPQAGFQAMSDLALQKYHGGRTTADSLIAAPGGWTPGNHVAAANVARSMGIGPHDDLGLADPGRMFSFQRALAKQEGAPKLLAGLAGGAFGRTSQQPRPAPTTADQYQTWPKELRPSHESDYPKLNIPPSGGPSVPETPSEQGQQAPRQEPQQQQTQEIPYPKMPEPEPYSPPKPIDVRQFAPQQQQEQQQPQQAAGQGVGLPRVQSPDDIKRLNLQPGHGFIGPDGLVHWVPFPGREAAA
jgi:hypothetical protein